MSTTPIDSATEDIKGPKYIEIGDPLGESFTCANNYTVSGSLSPAPTSDITVTATWTKTGGTGPAPNPKSTTTNTSNYSIPFTNLKPGIYTITVSCPGYNPTAISSFEVRVCQIRLSDDRAGQAAQQDPTSQSISGRSVDINYQVPAYITNPLYATVALENDIDRRLIAFQADDDIRNGYVRVRFSDLASGRYYARILIYCLSVRPQYFGETIDV